MARASVSPLDSSGERDAGHCVMYGGGAGGVVVRGVVTGVFGVEFLAVTVLGEAPVGFRVVRPQRLGFRREARSHDGGARCRMRLVLRIVREDRR
ncbi:hypothetical protein [Nocardia sp. NPDC020380]|uniref:hypothetical protein n=1 Tax=Nocardia sp. NPDC020380 TaxID=3364309 RepID=UPI00379E5120